MNASNYQQNHPKTYVGYALALAIGGSKSEADSLVEEYVIGTTNGPRLGATYLGLIEKNDDGEYELTKRGKWLEQNAPTLFEAESPEDALAKFDDLRGSSKRFVEVFPQLAAHGVVIARGDPTIDHLVEYLQEMHKAGYEEIRTADLYDYIAEDDEEIADEALVTEDDGDREWRYQSTYQMKNLCWHLGVFQTKGKKVSYPDGDEVTWDLEAALGGPITIDEESNDD